MASNTCKKHKGMKVSYNPRKFKKCLLCSEEQQNRLLSALRDFWQLASLHIESMEMISNHSTDEKHEEVRKKFQETAEKLYKHLDEATEETISVRA